MKNVVIFPKQPIKADAWAEYEQILKTELKGQFVIMGFPQEILDSVLVRMRRMFEDCVMVTSAATKDCSFSVELPVPKEVCDSVKEQMENALQGVFPKYLRHILASGVFIEVARMEAELYSLRNEIGSKVS